MEFTVLNRVFCLFSIVPNSSNTFELHFGLGPNDLCFMFFQSVMYLHVQLWFQDFLRFAHLSNLLPSSWYQLDSNKQLSRPDVKVASDAITMCLKWSSRQISYMI